jgi:hypothetical protein
MTCGFEIEPVNRRFASSYLARGASFRSRAFARGRENAVDDEQVLSEQDKEIARMLAPRIGALVQDNGFVPPLEVHLIDAYNHAVFCLQMDAQGFFRNLRDTGPPIQLLFPINITVADKNGKTWSTSVAAADLPSLY